MTGSTKDPSHLEALLELRSVVDELVEQSLIHRHNLAEVMEQLLPAVAAKVGAKGVFVQSYGEDLALNLYTWPADLRIPEREEAFERTNAEKREHVAIASATKDELLVMRPLDVAGEWFGAAGFVFAGDEARSQAQLAELLTMMCEDLDNYLYAIRAAREKHNVMMELAVALRHRVLGRGLEKAIAILVRAVPLDRMLLTYVAEENAEATLHVQLYENGVLKLDTMSGRPPDAEAIVAEGRDYLYGRSTKLLERLHFVNAQEEVLINGVTKSVVVGKMMVTSRHGSFNTYDRELLGSFAGFIRQRVVDFNKEWRRLAASFRQDDVARLLRSDDYEQRFLSPREEEVAIVFTDIAGFTRISESILKTPSAVAHLVEGWSHEAVNLVWELGGVFDKMVGDCIIALFGPPFYEQGPGERLAAAIECARRIREMTHKLVERPGYEALRGVDLGVATGINLAPLFVGTFGPNHNFTGFSSGMNATARLQGCAKLDEIFVMEEAIERLPPESACRFGEPQSAAVKNVAAPIRFRALL